VARIGKLDEGISTITGNFSGSGHGLKYSKQYIGYLSIPHEFRSGQEFIK